MSDLAQRLKIVISDAVARAALRVPMLERAVVGGCRNEELRHALRLGAVAVGFTRVLRGRELRVAQLGGYQLQVNIAEELGTSQYFFGDPGTLWFTSKLIREGDACVDAGANVGHYCFQMASQVGASGHVLAFEANPEFVLILQNSAALNGYEPRIAVHSEALYETSGEQMTFYVSVNSRNSGTSSLVNHGWFVQEDNAITVNTVTLDDAAKRAGIDHFRLVKVDVERAKEFVIAGAHGLLSSKRIDFLIVELHAGTEAQRRLLDHGYVGWLPKPEDRTIVPIEQIAPDTFGDFLFASPDKVEELKRLLAPIARMV